MTAAGTEHACWTPAWVRRVTQGRWLTPVGPKKGISTLSGTFSGAPGDELVLTGIGIDSRTIMPGQIFLAVKGENFDGHTFLDKAFQAGATIAVIERQDAPIPKDAQGVLLVDNTVDALHKLAKAYRQVLRDAGCTVIAVAGSNGKTTTRHLIHAVLSSKLKGTQSPKSFNNHLGVPLTMLGARAGDRFLVAEVGTNHPGEIDALGALLQPDAAVITSIGQEHIEFFGDLQGVAEEEAAIIPHVAPGGALFIEADAFEWVSQASGFDPARPAVIYRASVTQPTHRHADGSLRQRLRFSGSTTADLPLPAPHDATNATAAVEVGRWMGLDDQQIKAALQNVKPMPGRLEVKRFGDVTVIDDTYNANPDSMCAALSVLADYPIEPTGRRVAVLGDMLELGPASQDAHRAVADSTHAMLASGILDHLVLVGPLMSAAAEAIASGPLASCITRFDTPDDHALDAIAKLIRPGDTVLCKASRGLQLERLLPRIAGGWENRNAGNAGKQESRK